MITANPGDGAPNLGARSFSNSKEVGRSQWATQCSRCLCMDHSRRSCSSPIRCMKCLKLGHVKRLCITKAQPRITWIPKALVSMVKVTSTQPKLVWMPKIPSNTHPENSKESALPNNEGNLNDNLDCRARVTDPPPSNTEEQTVQSNPIPQHPSPSPPPENPILPEEEEEGGVEPECATMANFPVNPEPYLLAGLTIDHGWNRPARGRVALGGEPTREHEDYAIVSIDPMPAEVNALRPTLDLVVQFLEHNQQVKVESHHLSPLGLGLIRLRSVLQRDQLVRNSPLNFGGQIVTIVNHDEGINSRFCPYIRLAWIMFLAFPLDFQKDLYVNAAVAPYGRVLAWYTNDNKSRVLARVLLLSPNRVPRSLVVSRGSVMGGIGRSWSVPVYLLNGNFPDEFQREEDPVPFDGEPHPEHGPPVLGANPMPPDWQGEQQGADMGFGPQFNHARHSHHGHAAPAAPAAQDWLT